MEMVVPARGLCADVMSSDGDVSGAVTLLEWLLVPTLAAALLDRSEHTQETACTIASTSLIYRPAA